MTRYLLSNNTAPQIGDVRWAERMGHYQIYDGQRWLQLTNSLNTLPAEEEGYTPPPEEDLPLSWYLSVAFPSEECDQSD